MHLGAIGYVEFQNVAMWLSSLWHVEVEGITVCGIKGPFSIFFNLCEREMEML